MTSSGHDLNLALSNGVGVESTVVDISGIDPGLVLRPLAMLPGDATIRLGPGIVERATWTPDGPGSVRATWQRGDSRARVETFGDGASWLCERAAQLLGANDDPSGFDPSSPVVRELWRRFRGDRIPRTETVWHDLSWAIVQQRVHRRDAAAQWQRLVRLLGEPAPGLDGLFVPPDPRRLIGLAPWALRPLGIDAHRAGALMSAAGHATALQRLVAEPAQLAMRKAQQVRGIGPWTASCLSAFSLGDPDSVIIGDVGIPSLISATLTGERYANDAQMLELLEPFRPHRYRVLRLTFAARLGRGRG